MALGTAVKSIARATFTMSATFFFLAVILLFFFDIGPGEQVILAGTVFLSSATGVGSVMLMRKMRRSDAEMARHREAEARARGNMTMDEWIGKNKGDLT